MSYILSKKAILSFFGINDNKMKVYYHFRSTSKEKKKGIIHAKNAEKKGRKI